jgi:hypothetical protein
MKWRSWMVFCTLAGVCAAQPRAQGQPAQQGPPKRVCPLSDNQLKKAQDIFAKIADVLRHPRCINCHGAEDPFDKEKASETHSGGFYKVAVDEGGDVDEEKTNAQCTKDCHAGFPGWSMAPNAVFFVGLDNTGLCKLMKFKNVVAHFRNDEGGTQFIAEAFTGRRGLAGQGLDMVGDENPAPVPNTTQPQLTQLVSDWIGAMGGKFQGDERCGCEPVHFAVGVLYHANINMGSVLQQLTEMGPIDVPITFHDDGTYEGTGQLPLAGAGRDRGCASQSEGSLNIRISGKAVEDETNSSMHIELTNTGPATGTTGVQCPMYSGVFPLQGGNKRLVTFDAQGRAGEKAEAPFPLGPLVDAHVQVQIIDLSSPAAPAKP